MLKQLAVLVQIGAVSSADTPARSANSKGVEDARRDQAVAIQGEGGEISDQGDEGF
ncbi:MAG TPA: hypothetical protein VMY42_11190 [Thermoguttaceae bacterium]|nr:hypothetical protein [Thermoguttaceae bacterium]